MFAAPAVQVRKAFADLIDDQASLARVVTGFERIIIESFYPGRNPVRGSITAHHVRDRFQILERWFRVLRAEKRWGLHRILDTLPEALHAELNGSTWEPDSRACWMPGDGQ